MNFFVASPTQIFVFGNLGVAFGTMLFAETGKFFFFHLFYARITETEVASCFSFAFGTDAHREKLRNKIIVSWSLICGCPCSVIWVSDFMSALCRKPQIIIYLKRHNLRTAPFYFFFDKLDCPNSACSDFRFFSRIFLNFNFIANFFSERGSIFQDS